MHFIQTKILDSLKTAKILRNHEMRPRNIENNLFQYHLKKLQNIGYIRKEQHGYTLTKRGLAYAVYNSSELHTMRKQPIISTILFIRNEKNEMLLRVKTHQPFIGMHGLVWGKMHTNENTGDAAKREFRQKVHDDDSVASFTYFGTAHITIKQEDCIIMEFIGLLFDVVVPVGLTLKPNVFMERITKYNETLSPGTKELLEAYFHKQTFIEETIQYREP